MMALIEHDIVPVVYTEGSYNTRLEYLKDIPKHKAVYHFEKVDLKLAKKELGDIACLMGGFPVYTVRYGTPAEVVEQVKRTLDIMAPGGGYLFSTGYSLEDAPEENMDALLNAVDKYGKY
jgi:uroporphyrinogen-III decarboxylase